MRRQRQLQDSISFRLSGPLGERLRSEAERADRTIGDVIREYLSAGVQTLDAQRREPQVHAAPSKIKAFSAQDYRG